MQNQNISHSPDQWSIIENDFNSDYIGKCEVIMALGNGYMGIRSTPEEKYLTETRNWFVSGTFNKAHDTEVTELPNIPDVIQMTLEINGRRFTLDEGQVKSYTRSLDLKTGELVRNILWHTDETGDLDIEFHRLVSSHDLHLVAQEIRIKPLEKDCQIKVVSGINGQVTNSGAQHFVEGSKRFYDKKVMHMNQVTTESDIEVFINVMHRIVLDDQRLDHDTLIMMDRRKIFGHMSFSTSVGSQVSITKFSNVGTTRDLEFVDMDRESIKKELLNRIEGYWDKSFQEVLEASGLALKDKLWDQARVEIDSSVSFDQVAARFAMYHLYGMMPAHDKRMGIGAKGLSGEGYKGHSFWDTEVFMFPYFLYTRPELARQLLEYRYLTLPGARKKAYENGFEGAQFPWESAWLEDGEVTPVWGAADIVTGKSTKIWSGFIEQHISADIAFAIYQYYNVTGDEAFMEDFGYEMLFETAKFWASRLEDGQDGLLHINNVIGPDEYKEHVDDNAFTNYLVDLNFELSISFAKKVRDENPKLYKDFDKKLGLDSWISVWEEKRRKIFLPRPNQDRVIPQDSTYLTKEIIDLTKYKNQEHVGSLFHDYNLTQVNNMQVSKQADIMMLFYLREDLFSREVKLANWEYYEPKTLHDSSLSLSTHAIIANDIGNKDLAYELYTRCREIDLGQNMKSSDHGIHAASLGGMLQVVLNGFGGLRILNGKLRIEPNIPNTWKSLTYDFHWQGDTLRVEVSQTEFVISNMTKNNDMVEFSYKGNDYLLREKTTVLLDKVSK